MAHKKGAGSTDNGRDSHSKRLGVKMFGGERAIAGNILIRQRGTKYHPGENVYMGRDHTLHAGIDGLVTFRRTRKDRNYVSITPYELASNANTAGQERLAFQETVAPVAKSPAQPIEVMEESAPVADVEASAPMVNDDIIAAAPEVEAPVMEEEATFVASAPEAEAAAPIVEEEIVASSDPVVEERQVSAAQPSPQPDDLKIVEGIGPKIEQLLKDGGIHTWTDLAATPVDRLHEILDAAGQRYQIHDPSTWPAQSKFAAAGHWEELKEYQEMLTSGRDLTE